MNSVASLMPAGTESRSKPILWAGLMNFGLGTRQLDGSSISVIGCEKKMFHRMLRHLI